MKLNKHILFFLSVLLLITIISEGFFKIICRVFGSVFVMVSGSGQVVPVPSLGFVSHVAIQHELQCSDKKPLLN